MNDFELEIQLCDVNLTLCESNFEKLKRFATVQKQKNRKLNRILAETRKNNKVLKSSVNEQLIKGFGHLTLTAEILNESLKF